MSVQSSTIESLFLQRTNLIGKLSEANAEHLRLLQLGGGIEILGMSEPHNPEFVQKKSETDMRIASSQAILEMLEFDLAQIDDRIETALNEEA